MILPCFYPSILRMPSARDREIMRGETAPIPIMRTSFSSDRSDRLRTSKMMGSCTSLCLLTYKETKRRRKIRWMNKKRNRKEYKNKRIFKRQFLNQRQNQDLLKILLELRRQQRKGRGARRKISTVKRTITLENTYQGRKEGRSSRRKEEPIKGTKQQDQEESRGEKEPIPLRYKKSREKQHFCKIRSQKGAQKDLKIQEG